MVYNYKQYGASCDRIPGHTGTIDTICAYEENIILTGSEDGAIRAVNINPNRYIGIVGAMLGGIAVANNQILRPA